MTTIDDFRAYTLVKTTEDVSSIARAVYELCYRRHWDNNNIKLKYFLANKLRTFSNALKEPGNTNAMNLVYTEHFNTYLDLWNYLNKEEQE